MINTLEDLREFGYDIDNLTEENWDYISKYQKLSEEFIERYQDKIDWDYISIYQKLSEDFIEKHQDKVDWSYISEFQKLSERFIKKYKDRVNWLFVSESQKLSENFIEKHQNIVDWDYISIYQKLSEDFIEKFKDKVDWNLISIYQKLSESFIEKFKGDVYWGCISQYQHLSNSFIEKYRAEKRLAMSLIRDSWYYKPTEFKKEQVINTNLYDCYDNYFIAYKGIRSDNYSKYNFQYQYFVGNTYECFADHSGEEDSFGLSAWTYEGAKKYCNEKIIKVKIYYKDVARVVYNGGKIRCTKFEVLEELNND